MRPLTGHTLTSVPFKGDMCICTDVLILDHLDTNFALGSSTHNLQLCIQKTRQLQLAISGRTWRPACWHVCCIVRLQIQALVKLCAGASFAAALPSMLYQMRAPSPKGLLLGMANSSLAFFLFSYQVGCLLCIMLLVSSSANWQCVECRSQFHCY